jgi:arylsulfatase A-like enzyme
MWMRLLLGLTMVLVAMSAPALAAEKINVVFFLIDDLGYMDIGANNPKSFYETPHIDSIAATGMRFTDGYAANPVCSPTRYSIMTGKYPSRVDATNFFSGKRSGKFLPAPLHSDMPLKEVTIAEALKEQGYATFFAGKWHLGPTEEFWPENQGFDVNKGGHNKGGPWNGGKYFSPYGNPRLTDGPKGEHLPIRLANETNAFIEANKGKPFFAYLAPYSVHTPLLGRKDLVEKYKKKAAEIAGAEFGDEEQVTGKRARRVRILQKHAIYAAMMESMDTCVGMVLTKLKELGLQKKTIIVFTSDNGGLSTSEGSPTSNLPLRGGKGWVFEGGIREPFLFSVPGMTKAGSVSSVPVISTDFYPTILELIGAPLKPTQHQDGVSLVSLLKGGGQLDREALYWHYPHYSNQGGIPGGAIRMGDWKLFERYEDGRVHLYNLRQDIGEKSDLAAEQVERVKTMRTKLHTWYTDVDAKFLRAKKGAGAKPWRPGA